MKNILKYFPLIINLLILSNAFAVVPSVTLSISETEIIEINSITITATLSEVSAENVTVSISASGDASSSDFSLDPNTITIQAGMTSGNITLETINDNLLEGDETLIISISSVTNATEDGTQEKVLTIIDDEDFGTIVLSFHNDGRESGPNEIEFCAVLAKFVINATGAAITIDIDYDGGSATINNDFNDFSGSKISIPNGSGSGCITIPVIDDAILEGPETVDAILSNPSRGTLIINSNSRNVEAIINDNEGPSASISVDNLNINENSGVATLTASISQVSAFDTTIVFNFSGTADNSDYSTSLTEIDRLTIPAGQTTGTTEITTINDTDDETDETLIISVVTVLNGTENNTQEVNLLIIDDDTTPNVTLNVNDNSIIENGGVAIYTATLSEVAGSDVEVNLAFSGTASSNDYTASNSSILIIAGETTGQITVTANDDLEDENNETVIVDIDSVSNAVESGTQSATTTIIDSSTDTDNDGISDSQEIIDGSSPSDRGSNISVLGTTICSPWSGLFKNPGSSLLNIMEHVNNSMSEITVRSTIFSKSGIAQSSEEFTIAPNSIHELLVHNMQGWTLNSFGQVCSSIISGNPGDMDGRMVFYKPETQGGFEFAFAIPFSNGINGAQFITFNTIQPSLNRKDFANRVANLIQISNMETTTQTGILYFYKSNGSILRQQSVTLAAKASQHFSGHQFGASKSGLVEFRPSDNSAKFYMQNARYYHNNRKFINVFDSASILNGTIGNGQWISVPVNTVGSTSILEIANTKSSTIALRVRVYDLAGRSKMNLKFNMPAHRTVHLTMNPILKSQSGVANITVAGNIEDSVIATAMQYGYTSSRKIQSVHSITAKQALGTTLKGTYNTFLNQNCSLLITNPTDKVQNANIRMTRQDGNIIVAGELVSVPANGGFVYDICSRDVDSSLGVITTSPSVSNSLYTTILRQGNFDDYRFSTSSNM